MDMKRIGKYEVIKKIGSGGMGDVYLGRQESLNRLVAIKILPGHFSNDKNIVERFNREAHAISRLEHQNIVTIFEYGIEEDRHFIAMQYVEGQTIKEMIQKKRFMPELQAILYCKQISRALKYAHEKKVIHRDIKSQNIMVTKENKLYVMDFGLAKIFDRTDITQSGFVVGSPEYMSPEQSQGMELTPQTDIYSLGVVFFEILTGQLPFYAENSLGVAYKHVHEKPPSLRDLNPKIHERLESIVLKMMEKDRRQRYETIDHLLVDLDYYVNTVIEGGSPKILPLQPKPKGRLKRLVWPLKFSFTYFWLGGTLALGILLGRCSEKYPSWMHFETSGEHQISELTVTASSQDREGNHSYEVGNLTDGKTETAWAEGVGGVGINEYITVSFRKNYIVTKIGMIPGYAKVMNDKYGDRFLKNPRIKKAQFYFSDNTVQEMEFKDSREMQYKVLLPGIRTGFVRIVIEEVYPGEEWDDTSISEIEVWGMKG